MKKKSGAVIIGGGVMGASIQYNLADGGMTDTLLVEQDALGSGATSRSQAILRMHYSNEVTSRLAWESLNIFKNFESITGSPSGYTCTGYFLVADEGNSTAMETNVAMHRSLGINAEIVSQENVREISPTLSVQENEFFAYEPESGYADPYLVTTGYAKRSRDLGAEIATGTRVRDIEIVGGRVVSVNTTAGRIETPLVVIAAGPWSKKLFDRIGVDMPLGTVRHQIIMIHRPRKMSLGHPSIGDIVNDLSSRPDAGDITLIGIGEEESVGPEKYNKKIDMSVVPAAMSGITRRFPDMDGAEYRGGWAGLFTVTPDWHPVLDRIEGIDGLYCAVGFSGHGFKLSPMIGVVMAELIIKGEARSVDISMLDLKRFEEHRLLTSRYSMAVLA